LRCILSQAAEARAPAVLLTAYVPSRTWRQATHPGTGGSHAQVAKTVTSTAHLASRSLLRARGDGVCARLEDQPPAAMRARRGPWISIAEHLLAAWVRRQDESHRRARVGPVDVHGGAERPRPLPQHLERTAAPLDRSVVRDLDLEPAFVLGRPNADGEHRR